ncbi:acetyltransferase [Raineya orbicola]|uniref:Sugar O-acyltransferase, sialic acid O-acetyltransferase NeuD family n=1 Tax=Raineya orbicola TaxID=2016530 RepID=A0A2N3IHM1_9BACT|nr:acetyltransferase [Raineya orbicola]PKQ69794.1 Sugar O-acyltransferase, sialic acid O-acetyltransferase NeuD family [Raineya orbicola]
MTPLLIFPCGGNSIEALDCIDESKYRVIGFVDDNPEKIGKKYFDIEVFDRTAFECFPDAKVLACIGSPYNFKKRGEIIASLGVAKERFVNIIHPSAKVSKFATIGTNCLIMAGVVISANAKIGDNVIILPNSVIHHDTEIGDNTCIGSNIVVAGFTKIGKNCYIGSGSNIINNISVGSNTLIGMGTNVVKSVGENKKIVGNPAREIQ